MTNVSCLCIELFIVQASILIPWSVGIVLPTNQSPKVAANSSHNWSVYGSDNAGSKYSPLAQINRENFQQLKVAWKWRSPDEAITKANPKVKTWVWESTPLMVDGTLYSSTSLSQVAAIDAATGKLKWIYDPGTWKATTPPNHGFVHRGITYWAEKADHRILYGTGDGYLICLNAATGKPVSNFGKAGRIDLTEGLSRKVDRTLYGVTSPPTICRDVVVVGSSILDFPMVKDMPPGTVRGFDVRTGKEKWQFRTVPKAGDFGSDTWEKDSWKVTGSANVWSMMSADEKLGTVYLPVSTPSNDYYGGERPGNGLFGESLVCLDAQTGVRKWHYQLVHHGLWDMDPPAAPNLVDITVNGKPIRAVAQVTKQGFCYVFDRVTGEPVWPIEERAVPQSTIPGEHTSLTQPFPTKPAPLDRQGMTKEDVVDFSPDIRDTALKILEKYNYGPLFTPPSL